MTDLICQHCQEICISIEWSFKKNVKFAEPQRKLHTGWVCICKDQSLVEGMKDIETGFPLVTFSSVEDFKEKWSQGNRKDEKRATGREK